MVEPLSMMSTEELYQRAKQRVDDDGRLSLYADDILYDWPEGDEHWVWVITAPVDDIMEWAKQIKYGTEEG